MNQTCLKKIMCGIDLELQIINLLLTGSLKSTMSQIPQLIRFNESKNLILNTIDQEGVRASSNKLLSPFTWSNLNLKLPKLNKQTPTISTIQENNQQNNRKIISKNKRTDKTKLQNINKTIDLNSSLDNKETKSEHINGNKNRYKKTSLQKNSVSINLDAPINTMDQQTRLKFYKRDLISRHLAHKINKNQQYKPQQTSIQLTFTRVRSPSVTSNNNSTKSLTPMTFSFNKMQTFIYKALIKANLCQVPQKDAIILPELVWSDHYLDSTKILKDQIHNHIYNADKLTTKNTLHELQSANGSQNYPQSFLMPFQYQIFCEEYEQQIIKICLKQIIKNAYEKIDENKISMKSLGFLLQQINNKTNTNFVMNQDTLMTLRLCLYLEYYRKAKNYRFFQNFQYYVPMEIKLQESVLSSLFKTCFQYWQAIIKNLNTKNSSPVSHFNTNNINLDVLNVLWNYHCMLLKYEPDYQCISYRNMWIVKPIASSRGAGIALLKNSAQFLSVNHNRFQITNKTKLNNKIIQKYIEQPLLLKKDDRFKDRKFDIRQWVLITCDKQSGSPLIYVYEDAYCRFSDLKFIYSHNRGDQGRIHLTNYSVSDKNNPKLSLMLLSELFESEYPHLKQIYNDQVNKIVVQSILNAKDIKFQPNRFQILGFDLIFDQFNKLWLLQINLNPACQSARSPQLQKMAESMVANMVKIVRAASRKISIKKNERKQIGWQIVYGQERFIQADLQQETVETKIKPFYELSLGKDSLIQEVRRRNIMINMIKKTISVINLKEVWEILKKINPIQGQSKDKAQEHETKQQIIESKT